MLSNSKLSCLHTLNPLPRWTIVSQKSSRPNMFDISCLFAYSAFLFVSYQSTYMMCPVLSPWHVSFLSIKISSKIIPNTVIIFIDKLLKNTGITFRFLWWSSRCPGCGTSARGPSSPGGTRSNPAPGSFRTFGLPSVEQTVRRRRRDFRPFRRWDVFFDVFDRLRLLVKL